MTRETCALCGAQCYTYSWMETRVIECEVYVDGMDTFRMNVRKGVERETKREIMKHYPSATVRFR